MIKGQGLPVNIIVMMILGLVLFGLGMAMFTQIASSSEDSVDDLNDRIKSDIASLECSGEQWICAPNYKMGNGDRMTFELFAANRGNTNDQFSVDFNLSEVDPGKFGITNDCGSILITHPSISPNIRAGFSASFPFVVRASRVGDTPCSFVTSVNLEDSSGDVVGRAPIIIRIE